MSPQSWEMVAPGRYATEYQGHILQAIRKDGPYEKDTRPYLAVVDRVPLEPGEWSLNRAKTRAIRHVERQHTTSKADRIFRPNLGSGDARPIPIIIPEPQPDPVLQEHARAIDGVLELPPPEPEVQEPEPDPAPEPAPVSQAAHALLFVTLTDPDLLKAINALRETLSLLREFSDVKCTVTLPPTLEL